MQLSSCQLAFSVWNQKREFLVGNEGVRYPISPFKGFYRFTDGIRIAGQLDEAKAAESLWNEAKNRTLVNRYVAHRRIHAHWATLKLLLKGSTCGTVAAGIV